MTQINNFSISPSLVITTSIPTTEEVLQDDNAGIKTSTSAALLPTINSNIVTDLLPSLKKNILAAKNSQNSENNVDKSRGGIFKNRRRVHSSENYKEKSASKATPNTAVVRNSTAAEILLKKLQSTQRIRTYHDPGFKSRKVVRRPRVKTLEELRSESNAANKAVNAIQNNNKNSSRSNLLEDSPILTSNVLLLADQKQNHKAASRVAPQGSQHFEWSKRQKFKNRFRLFKSNPTTSTTTSTTTTKDTVSSEEVSAAQSNLNKSDA